MWWRVVDRGRLARSLTSERYEPGVSWTTS